MTCSESHSWPKRTVQLSISCPKPECPTQFYFCAWLKSPPDQPCRLSYKPSGWNVPASLIKCVTFAKVTSLHVHISGLKTEGPTIRDRGWEIYFPDGSPRREKPQVFRPCFVTSPRTTARSSLKNDSKTFCSWSAILGGLRAGLITVYLSHEVFTLETLRR